MVRATDLPLDLWNLFIGLACTDDGTTARSLSMTNTVLRELSQPFRYTTITLTHNGQIVAFDKHISGVPVTLRHTKNLFVSFHHHLGDEELEALYRVVTFVSSTLEILSIHDAPCIPLEQILPRLPALRDLALHRPMRYKRIPDRSTLAMREEISHFPALNCLHLEGYAERASTELRLEKLSPFLKRFYSSTFIFCRHLEDFSDFPASVEEIVVPIDEKYKDALGIECYLLRGWCNQPHSESQRILYHPKGLQLSTKLKLTNWRYPSNLSLENWKADWLERMNGKVILRDRTEIPFPIKERMMEGQRSS